MSINFHRVFSVDVIHPVLDLVVWMRIEWVDPRLTWDPLEYGNLTKIWMWIGEYTIRFTISLSCSHLVLKIVKTVILIRLFTSSTQHSDR